MRAFPTLLCIALFSGFGLVRAQFEDYNHPELQWRTIETPHFFVHFHQGEERSAQWVARIAEEVYDPVTSLYHYQPKDKVHFIIRDHDDFSGGAAYYYDNKIEIWASDLDFDLRGTHNWLRNVVTHEFTHIVSLQVSQKLLRRIPAVYLQFINYEEEKRPDVLYGYPNRLVSYPIAGTVIPPWYAEGVAQYAACQAGNDAWDSHRDMILRSAVLENQLLSHREMSAFGKNSIGNEMVYNQGFALVFYIAERYGKESLEKISRKMKLPWRFSFSSALKSVIGKSENTLYQEWKSWLTQQYQAGIREIQKNVVQGKLLEKQGTANFYPVWSPDGGKIAYISNRGADYISQTSLWIYSFKGNKFKRIARNVTSSVSWSPDGGKIVFAKRKKSNRFGCHFYDIYIYDLKRKKEIRVTRGLRAHSPDWHPDGKTIICVIAADGTENLAVIDIDGKNARYLTHFKDGEQVYRPRWSRNGKVIVFATAKGRGRDIALISADGKRLKYVIDSPDDSRDPVFSHDGRKIYFSWDKSGIFNIYSLDLYSWQEKQLTNVLGGAFMPAVNKNGQIVYSHYSADGYKIAWIKKPQRLRGGRYLALKSFKKSLTDKKYNPGRPPHYKPRPYKNMYTQLSILPRLMLDYGRGKFGAYFYSSDVLDKYSLLGGAAVNRLWDYDLFGIFEYRRFWPTFFLEAYNQVRHTQEGNYKYKYNLIEVDLGVDFKLNDNQKLRAAFIFSHYNGKLKTTLYGQEVKLNYTYFIGRDFSLEWRYRGLHSAVDSEINPTGRTISLQFHRELNKFIDGFTISPEYGTLVEVYKNHYYDKIHLDWQEYLKLPWGRHTLGLRLKGGVIDKPVDSFFYFFAGGLVGMKGYPYYSIEGRKMAIASLAYRFPLIRHMNFRLFTMYFDKLYAAFYYDYGNAWNEDKVPFEKFKSDAGLQLRLESLSFYSYPARIFFDVAYGFNDFVTRRDEKEFRYGKEFRYYFGLSFAFLD